MNTLESTNTKSPPPHPFEAVFESRVRPKGTLVMALRAPKSGELAQSYHSGVSAAQLTELWPLIEDSFREADGQELASREIRFLGRMRELHCFRRSDGAILAVLLECAGSDATGKELPRLAACFQDCADAPHIGSIIR